MVIRLFDRVRLRVARVDLGLSRGTVGIVVEIHKRPYLGYEVEFFDEQLRTISVESLPADSVEPAEPLNPGEEVPPSSGQ